METAKINLEKKTVSSKKFLITSFETTLKELNEKANTEALALYGETQRIGLVPAGPMEFIYHGVTADMEKKFLLRIAVPVSEEKPCDDKYVYYTTEAFTCFSHSFKGAISDLPQVYEGVFAEIGAQKIIPSDEIREVYVVWEGIESSENVTEIQIGTLS